MSAIARWLLGIVATLTVIAAAVWAWMVHRKNQARDDQLVQSAEKLAAAEKREAADKVADAGAAAEVRVKEADAKAEKEAQDHAGSGSLIDYLRGKSSGR